MTAELLENPELEAAVVEAPDELGPRMVYGDWLAAQGDPRGPWFALSAAVEAAPLDVRLRSAATELFHAHGELFLGDGVALRPNAWFGWLGGFLDELRLPCSDETDVPHAARALFGHPHARFVRHVALGALPQLEEVVDALATAGLPLLEGLTLIDAPVDLRALPIDLDGLLAQVPVRRLGARGVRWSVPQPALRELCCDSGEVSLATLAATTPGLEELTLDCARHAPTALELAQLLGALPRLHTLRVLGHPEPESVIGALTPPPAQLRCLDLSHSLLADASRVHGWPLEIDFVALRTQVAPEVADRLAAAGRRVAITQPALRPGANLREDTGGDTWWVHRAKTEGRRALRLVPNAGRQLFESAIRNTGSQTYDLDVMDTCVTLPSQRWHAWPWSAAASARSWKKQYGLSEAIAREGLMREPHEPNFYAFVTYGLRRQGLLTEAVAEVPRAELALQQPPKVAQETGAPLCLIDCMFTLAQAGDYAAALALADRLSKIDDPNLQAMRAMCHVAAGQPDPARVALGKPAVTTGAASYVREPARRAIYDHAIAAVALLTAPGQPVAEAAIDVALAAIERAWPVYPERNWFKTDPNLVAIREHPRFLALR